MSESNNSNHIGFPQIVNMVATSKLTRKTNKNKCYFINLRKVASKCRNAQYNQAKFPALFIRIKEPKATGLLFSSGRLTVLGARSQDDCQKASEKILKIINNIFSKNPYSFEQPSVAVRNIVATTNLGYQVVLSNINEDPNHKGHSVFHEHFSGLIYTVKNIKILVFYSGKVIITGAKKEQDIFQISEDLKQAFKCFQKKNYLSQAY